MMKRFLVTGAQGFVGRYLVAELLARHADAEVLGIGRSAASPNRFTHSIHAGYRSISAPLPAELNALFGDRRYRYAVADIQCREQLVPLMRDFQPHYVMHLASGLRDDPAEKLFRTNVEGTICLVDAVAEAADDLEMIVLGSSGGVYGRPQPGELPLTESAPCRPVELYSASKLAAEHAFRIQCDRYGLPGLCPRIFNVIGPGQDERHVCGRFASRIAAIQGGEAPPVIETGTLETTRDFIDVRDVAAALAALAEHGRAGDCINVAGGRETSIGEVLQTLLQVAGLEGSVTIRSGAPRSTDIPRHVADVTRLCDHGFQQQWNLERSLQSLLDYYTESIARAA